MASVRFIPTKVHGIIDYAMGTFLSTSPLYLKGIKKETIENKEKKNKLSAAQIVPYAMGAVSGIYSLFTNYELGAVKKIPMKVHLALDAVNGAFMALAPWIFGFSKKSWVPYVAIGVAELGAALFTQYEPDFGVGREQ